MSFKLQIKNNRIPFFTLIDLFIINKKNLIISIIRIQDNLIYLTTSLIFIALSIFQFIPFVFGLPIAIILLLFLPVNSRIIFNKKRQTLEKGQFYLNVKIFNYFKLIDLEALEIIASKVSTGGDDLSPGYFVYILEIGHIQHKNRIYLMQIDHKKDLITLQNSLHDTIHFKYLFE